MPERDLPVAERVRRIARRSGSGTARSTSCQLDVYGEVMDTLWLARSYGLDPDEDAWRLQRGLMN